MIRSVVVFCGSAFGHEEIFREKAYELGNLLANNKLRLVYGGSATGLMGVVANGVLEQKGKVIGILPRFLMDREVAHTGLTELMLVDDMHQRKAKMNELADAFIVLPGGLGTLEEFFEVLAWSQLGLHAKPIIVVNIDGFYDSLLLLIKNITRHGFIRSFETLPFIVCNTIQDIIDTIKS